MASFVSIRRIMEVIKNDKAILLELEKIVYPLIMKTLTATGHDSIDESVTCITIILFYGYQDRPVS